jgi:hypothetical protein
MRASDFIIDLIRHYIFKIVHICIFTDVESIILLCDYQFANVAIEGHKKGILTL